MGVIFTGSPSTVTCLVSSLITRPPAWYTDLFSAFRLPSEVYRRRLDFTLATSSRGLKGFVI